MEVILIHEWILYRINWKGVAQDSLYDDIISFF